MGSDVASGNDSQNTPSNNDNQQDSNKHGKTQNSTVMNDVLDTVLENIDGLLMDHIPPNPDLPALPPIPANTLPAQPPPSQIHHHHHHDINISIHSSHGQQQQPSYSMHPQPAMLMASSSATPSPHANMHISTEQNLYRHLTRNTSNMSHAHHRHHQQQTQQQHSVNMSDGNNLLIGHGAPAHPAMFGRPMQMQQPAQQCSEVEEVIQRQYQLAQQIHHTYKNYKRQFQRQPLNQSINTIDENQTGLHAAGAITASQSLPCLPVPRAQPQHAGHAHMTPSSSHHSLVSLASNQSAATSKSGHSRGSLHHHDDEGSKDAEHYESPHTDSRRTGSNVLFCGQSTKITLFTGGGNDRVQLKDYVFISKDCTSRLAAYIVQENWGKDNGLLYKYLDYIFRCQAFKRQVIVVNGKYLIFHSGLQRRNDKQFLYCLLNTNNKKYVTQKWRVPFGNIKNSFVSKNELLSKLPESYLLADYLPKRTRFFSDLSQLLYDDTYSIEVNWEERLTTNKDRICRVLGNVAFFDGKGKFMRLTELTEAFEKALKQTQRIAELNPRLAVAQGFIDTKNSNYRMELLLPLIIEFPKSSSTFYIFALAISKSPELEKKYIGKSILTMNMAYANARLVGYVDSSWLLYGDSNNARSDINDFFCGRK